MVENARLSDSFKIDSAALGSWHIGNPPDHRAIEISAANNVDISNQRCRQIIPADFDGFDYIIGMDHENVSDLMAIQPEGSSAKIAMMLDIALGQDGIVPDPYYGDSSGFKTAYCLLEEACAGLLKALHPSIK